MLHEGPLRGLLIYKENIMYTNNTKPFDKDFVLQVTVRNIHKDIDFSIRRTFERFSDFESGTEKHNEVFETLGVLHKMHTLLDEFETNNQHLFNTNQESK